MCPPSLHTKTLRPLQVIRVYTFLLSTYLQLLSLRDGTLLDREEKLRKKCSLSQKQHIVNTSVLSIEHSYPSIGNRRLDEDGKAELTETP